jgi:hypothetical protein
VTLAQRLTRRVEFSLGGQAWQVIFTYRALLLCQDTTGADMLNTNATDLSAAMLRALIFSALTVAGASCSIRDVGRAISTAKRLRIAREIVIDAWEASMPDPVEGEAPSKEVEGRKTTWIDAWAKAREQHGLTEDEWLDITPRMLAALREVRLDHLRWHEIQFARLTASIINHSFSPPRRPVKADELMIHRIPEEPQGPITGEYIMAAMARSRQGR